MAAAFYLGAHFRPSSGKVTMLSAMEPRGFDDKGLPIISAAMFRLRDDGHKVPRLAATAVAWRFLVLTNDGKGTFVVAAAPNEASFSRTSGDNYEFWVRDAGLLDCEWKVQVVRKVRYRLPRIFSFIASTVPGPTDIWTSDRMKPSLKRWKFEPRTATSERFRFPDRPTPANEQPAFLRSGATVFGNRELHY